MPWRDSRGYLENNLTVNHWRRYWTFKFFFIIFGNLHDLTAVGRAIINQLQHLVQHQTTYNNFVVSRMKERNYIFKPTQFSPANFTFEGKLLSVSN